MERAEFDRLIDAELRRHGVELVALAGYMRLLSPEFIRAWDGRILNIHPSLLPAYKGLDTHRRALEAGDAISGCSVHLVTEALDDGPVLAQAQVRSGRARRPKASPSGCSGKSISSIPKRSTGSPRRCGREKRNERRDRNGRGKTGKSGDPAPLDQSRRNPRGDRRPHLGAGALELLCRAARQRGRAQCRESGERRGFAACFS